MCQPADRSRTSTFTEMNRAEILDFLRKNKLQNRYVPDWIETQQSDRLAKLSAIVQQWMEEKVPQQATNAILQIAQSKRGINQTTKRDGMTLEEKFKKENFDLIAWEYISK